MKKNESILFFAIVLLGIVFQSCGNKNKTDDGLIGRDYDRDFLGMKYTVSVVGDTTDYSFLEVELNRIENSETLKSVYHSIVDVTENQGLYSGLKSAKPAGISVPVVWPGINTA
jgi:hypothetical protein